MVKLVQEGDLITDRKTGKVYQVLTGANGDLFILIDEVYVFLDDKYLERFNTFYKYALIHHIDREGASIEYYVNDCEVLERFKDYKSPKQSWKAFWKDNGRDFELINLQGATNTKTLDEIVQFLLRFSS